VRTQLMIVVIVSLIAGSGVAVLVGFIWWLGALPGSVVFGLWLMAIVGCYVWAIKPWHLRWGATDEEIARVMPGDGLAAEAGAATRAISIDAGVEEVWPWLLQLGWGKAGWYSYDWIDNDFKPSADRIMSEHQNLAAGDEILMAPGMGLTVQSVDRPRSIVSVMNDGSTSWCLALYPTSDGPTRLVSRWRPNLGLPLLMLAVVEPGAFIMEQKMLRGIRDRVEATGRIGTD